MTDLLVYGAYGYTGRLVVREAARRGGRPVLGGRDEGALAEQARRVDLPHRAFPVEEAAAELEDVDAVLNCAGPFVDTADPLVDACLETGTDYLDVSGEVAVFERLHRRDEAARDAGVTLLPGVGFSVVPTDCLAAHLATRAPDATHLALAVDVDGSVSPGTLKTALRSFDGEAAVRRDGRLVAVPPAYHTHRVDFGRRTRTVVTVPFGDLVTAYHTTGIPNVETFLALPRSARRALRLRRPLAALFAADPVRRGATRLVDRFVSGPTAAERRRGSVRIWGVARGGGRTAVSRLWTPHVYETTVQTAVTCAERVLDGEVDAGFRTPAGAFGPDLVLSVENVDRTDVAP